MMWIWTHLATAGITFPFPFRFTCLPVFSRLSASIHSVRGSDKAKEVSRIFWFHISFCMNGKSDIDQGELVQWPGIACFTLMYLFFFSLGLAWERRSVISCWISLGRQRFWQNGSGAKWLSRERVTMVWKCFFFFLGAGLSLKCFRLSNKFKH